MYGPGVILIREAMVRWRKGWASVFLLGFAYAIVEEGLDLSTFFNPKAGPVGVLGVYGHWLGVNWVWTVGLMLFHSAISIALPILLFRLAFPALRSQSLAAGRRVFGCFLVLFLDSIILFSIVNYWAGPTIILSSFIAVLGFILAARKVPANLLASRTRNIVRSPRTLSLLAALFFPAALLVGGISAGANVPPFLPIILEPLFFLLLLRLILRSIGHPENLAARTALATGLITPIMVFGIVASLASTPLILVADLVSVLFLRRLWRRHHNVSLTLIHRIPTISPEAPSLKG